MCLVAYMISICSFAQGDSTVPCSYSFSGKILDGETQEPLPGASIVFKDLNSTTLSDGNGTFMVRSLCAGEYIVESSSYGYKPVVARILISKNTHRNFVLHADTCLMESVIITIPEREMENTRSWVELSGRELDRTRGLSLGEALKVMPGVSTLQTGPSIFKPVIQGMYGNRVLILNNGVRQEGQQWGSEHAPEIDPFVASRITVIRGAASVQYGADAIGGVILVDPEALRKEHGLGGEVNLVGFTNNRQGVASAQLDYNIGKIKGLSLRAQGTLKQAGNSRTPCYYMANTGFKEYNFSWAAGYSKEKFNTELYYSQFNSTIGILSSSHIGNLSDLKSAVASTVPLETSGFSYKIGRPFQEISHELFRIKSEYKFTDLGRLQVILARQFNYRSEYDKHRPFNNVLADTPQVKFKITTHTASLLLDHNSIGAVKGIAGVDLIRQGNTTNGTFIPNFRSYAGGLYLIERWRRKRLELEAGARYDYKWMKIYRYEDDEIVSREFSFSNVSGVAGAIYTINNHWKARLNIGTAFRPVTVNELFSEGLHHGSVRKEYGNSNLKSEYAYNASLAFNYEYKKVYGEISVYNNYIQDYIYLAPGMVYDSLVQDYVPEYELSIRGAFPVFRYKQIDARFTGLDFTLNDSISKRIIFSSRLSLLRAYNTRANEHIVLTPPGSLEYGIRYSFDLSGKITENYIKLTHLLVSRKEKVPLNQDVAAPPPGYMLFSLETGGRWYVGKQPVDITFSVYNLLNNRYRDYMDRFRYFTDAAGRNFVLRIKLPLDFTKKSN